MSRLRWLIENGSVARPLYAKAVIKNGKPQFTYDPYHAVGFLSKERAEAWRQELNLDSTWRLAEHEFADDSD